MADLLNLPLHIFTIPFFLILATLVARLHHNNLVKLHGCTTRHSRELLLVYEFIPNGTVADHLHGNRKESGILSWDMRMKIATESASALSYLHASDIIHRDVKTNNILLDNHFSVKVADFGLSRLFPFETTHVSTAPQGTPGYLDPDYNKCYQVTNKSDVYSFGVVLVELISSLPKNSWRVSFVTEVYSNSTIVDRWCIESIFVKNSKKLEIFFNS